jgi:hypothetical protein
MKELRRNEFIDMLEMAEILYEVTDKFIKCDIPTLGAVTYFSKANKVQIDKGNEWVEQGYEYIKSVLYPSEMAKFNLEKPNSIKKDTFRDECAMRAMQSFLSNKIAMSEIEEIVGGVKEFNSVIDYIADLCYKYADAMVKQRKL